MFGMFAKKRHFTASAEKRCLVAAYAKGSVEDHSELVSRIVRAYSNAHVEASHTDVGMWDTFFEKNRDLHEAMFSEATARPILDNPGRTNMFYGFDNLMRDFIDSTKKKSSAEQDAWAAGLHGSLRTLADAIGATQIWNPETGKPAPDIETETLIDAISEAVGAPIKFPNPFPDEFGLMTERGLVSHRTIDAIYQAFRLKQLSQRYGDRVLEIGAGLGRTAYYAHLFGVKNYTIIDLPFTNISQANFLGRVLPRENVCLYGEPVIENAIKIMPASAFAGLDFDVVANIDSLTEMVPADTEKYCDGIMSRGQLFWSVNHEFNTEIVREMPRLRGRQFGRFPYWLRAGYVEELYLGDHEFDAVARSH